MKADRSLAARLELRGALRRLVAKHPELTAPESRARLEGYLAELAADPGEGAIGSLVGPPEGGVMAPKPATIPHPMLLSGDKHA